MKLIIISVLFGTCLAAIQFPNTQYIPPGNVDQDKYGGPVGYGHGTLRDGSEKKENATDTDEDSKGEKANEEENARNAGGTQSLYGVEWQGKNPVPGNYASGHYGQGVWEVPAVKNATETDEDSKGEKAKEGANAGNASGIHPLYGVEWQGKNPLPGNYAPGHYGQGFWEVPAVKNATETDEDSKGEKAKEGANAGNASGIHPLYGVEWQGKNPLPGNYAPGHYGQGVWEVPAVENATKTDEDNEGEKANEEANAGNASGIHPLYGVELQGKNPVPGNYAPGHYGQGVWEVPAVENATETDEDNKGEKAKEEETSGNASEIQPVYGGDWMNKNSVPGVYPLGHNCQGILEVPADEKMKLNESERSNLIDGFEH